ncbi:hypothetical protein PPACK8108_LOCUS1489 [Phakopsora pachyrhizi]|uniref:G-protein coupled receptors family 1 profile domain-containing protein n=1 Tax=Phakopsora pachyrhizi TaxID=170000 RepID=A0AAV0AJY5_PHAPC|nr:hypothetical protein PPACK8108_LOCUS1489 [Phakopsora pachyrhizi]
MSRLALNTAPELTCISSLSDSSFDGVYHAVQSFLGSKHNPQSFSWARITLITMLFAHFIMLLLALAVIFLRLPTRKFTLGSITRHGVLRPNATGCVTICCILFDIFAIIGLAMQLAIDCGISNPEAKAHIPGIKYVIIWFGVWCFCWSTACQYICARWDPPWKLGANDRALNVVPFPVIVMLNVTFVGVAFISITISATIFTLSNQRYIDLIRAIDNLGPKLISLKIKSNNSSTLVGVNLPMEPLHELDHLIYNFSHWLKIRILTCLGLNSCLLFVYTPFIFFTYIQLKRFMQFAPKEWAESKNGPQKHQPAQKKGFKIDCKKEMRSLLITAATIFSVFLVEWPLLVWEFIHISAGHCKSDEGLVMREMVANIFATLNIILHKFQLT